MLTVTSLMSSSSLSRKLRSSFFQKRRGTFQFILSTQQSHESQLLCHNTGEQVAKVKQLFRVEPDLTKACAGVDCVVECIVEVEDIKRNFFRQLNEVVDENVIIATNSSYMVSSRFADCVSNPSRLCNMHFYNPALVMKFVEVVQGPHTSAETGQAAYDFCVNTGKKPILMKKEIDGFAANRFSRVILQEARYLVENGYLTPQEVDIACEYGLNHPMGPFRLNDLTGINLSFDMM